MFLFLKKKNEEEDKPEIATPGSKPVELPDFIPYYCHYDNSTLLTKNGELLKIIRISSNNYGLNYESGDDTANTVRDNIRRAIADSISSDRFSLWVHTLRKRVPISYEGRFKEPLALYVHESWQKKHDWKHQFHNEIYISILHDGQRAELIDKKHLRNVLIPARNRAHRNMFLEKSHAELQRVADSMMQKIRQHYNARYLAVTERAPESPSPAGRVPEFYSEPMEFLGTLVNLKAETFPVSESQMDKGLCTHQVTFGYNALESRSPKGDKRFAGILTLKHYHEIPPETVDRILQYPLELFISHSFHFLPSSVALKQYREQKALFEMSEDAYSIKQSGLEAKLKANHKRPIDYGRHQTSVVVLTDDYRLLDSEMSKAQQVFADLGFIVVREDLKLEEAYWAQLPGNFEFIRRQDVIISSEIAGFTRLNLFPNGTSHGNHWGEAVALIPTVVNSPYFFNFHHQDNGHTLLFDFNSFNDHSGQVLLNFLVTSSLKFNPRLYIFDHAQASRLFFDKLGGQYHLFLPGYNQSARMSLNPFRLEANARNQSFLLAWCTTLVEPYVSFSQAHKDQLDAALNQLLAEPAERRHLGTFMEKLDMMGASDLAQALSHYHGRGEYAGLFDATHEAIDFKAFLHAFDFSQLNKAPHCIVALFSYLMHRIILSLDGTPTIIVLHNAWALLENNFFAPRLESLLEMLRQNNVMVIAATRNPQELINTQVLATLTQCCATRLYIPDDITIDYTSQPLRLTKHDSHMLRRMERQKGDFLIRQDNESIGLRANFDHMDDVRAIFAGDIKNLIAAGGRFASLPQFY